MADGRISKLVPVPACGKSCCACKDCKFGAEIRSLKVEDEEERKCFDPRRLYNYSGFPELCLCLWQ